MRTALLILSALCLAACATHPGAIAAGASAFVVALDQMLASGAIDQTQYAALKGGFDAVGDLQHSVSAIKGAQWGVGDWISTGLGGLLAGMGAYKATKTAAVKQVHKERGPITKVTHA